jgi:hypothetical protein
MVWLHASGGGVDLGVVLASEGDGVLALPALLRSAGSVLLGLTMVGHFLELEIQSTVSHKLPEKWQGFLFFTG